MAEGRTKVVVALSGGIDSAAAAAFLQRDGFDPIGVFMRHPFQPTLSPAEAAIFLSEGDPFDVISPNGPDSFSGETPSGESYIRRSWSPDLFSLPADAADAGRIARFLGIPFFLFDAESIFRRVTDDFVRQYLNGRTPNPCVLCNRILKFGALARLTDYFHADFFATGHYVRTEPADVWLNRVRETDDQREQPEEIVGGVDQWERRLAEGESSLKRDQRERPEDFVGGVDQRERRLAALLVGDSAKDQSYVLYGIDRRILPRLRFPVGGMTKEEVRRRVAELGVPIPPKRESQDVCFIPDGDNPDFVRRFGDGRSTEGDFVSEEGAILGRHSGYERFTVGQRKGLGVGFGERIFVQRIDALRRQVVLGPRESLARTEIDAENGNWLVDVPIGTPFRCRVKIRYRTPPVDATVLARADGMIHAVLDEPRYGVAPGQSLVCYFADRLLGGGVIK